MYNPHMGREHKKPVSPLGANVRVRRRRLGLSQARLAQLAGLSRGTVAAIEGSRYDSSETSTLRAIARVLDVEVSELILEPAQSEPAINFLMEFRASKWADVLQITKDEIHWLTALPSITWTGMRPDPETIARLLMWRRENALKSG